VGAISGILSLTVGRAIDRNALARMNDIQRHRGPDAGDLYAGGSIGLGNRRLASADGIPGEPPKSNEPGTVWITFSGRLFNRAELRADLQARGYCLRTASDSEVALRAYEADGVSSVERFNGQFAFAIWDERTRIMWLARDQLGICPLHYALVDDLLLFASEAKGVLAHPAVEAAIDEAAVSEALLCGTVFDGRTIFAPVRRLEAGCTLTVSPRQQRVTTYWSLPQPIPDVTDGEAGCAERLSELVDDAVRLRIAQDDEWGVLLSGGTDSSALAASAMRSASGAVRTFSIDFPNPWLGTHVDQHYAALAAEKLGTCHRTFIVEPEEYFSVLEKLAWHLEKPYNKAAATMYLLAARSASHARFVLSGEGMDEMLAGYVGARGLGLDEVPGNGAIRCFPWAPYHASVDRLFSEDFLTRNRPREMFADRLRGSLDDVPTDDTLNQSLHLYVRYFLRDLLELHDQSAYASGVETRYPFLDPRCAELLISMPSNLKFREGETKYIFKRAMRDRVPQEILERRKTHLPMPRDPASIVRQLDLARELLLDPSARTRRYFDADRLAQFISRDRVRSGTDMLTTWQVSMNLITLELLHRAYRV
jgi:asparagine synthase (glutamine-hydrolysing)